MTRLTTNEGTEEQRKGKDLLCSPVPSVVKIYLEQLP